MSLRSRFKRQPKAKKKVNPFPDREAIDYIVAKRQQYGKACANFGDVLNYSQQESGDFLVRLADTQTPEELAAAYPHVTQFRAKDVISVSLRKRGYFTDGFGGLFPVASNPLFEVSGNLPGRSASTTVKAFTKQGALRKGSRAIKGDLRSTPEFTVTKKNPQKRNPVFITDNIAMLTRNYNQAAQIAADALGRGDDEAFFSSPLNRQRTPPKS